MSFEGPDKVSSCGCSCSSTVKVSEPSLLHPSRQCDGIEMCSEDGVRYFNGELQYAVPALQANWWSHTLVYTNRLNEDTDFGNGYNWMVKEWWRLYQISGGEFLVPRGSRSALWFDSSLGARYGSLHKLTHDSGNGVYKLLSPNGTVTEFHDFNHATLPGRLKKQTTPGGKDITVTYSGTDISTVQISFSSSLLERFSYAYTSGRLSSVTLQRSTDGGSNWSNLRAARFEYHDGSDNHGLAGDLKKVVTQFKCPTTLTDHDFWYFRYYKDAAGGAGFAHGLKYAVGPQGTQRIGPSNLDNATDTTVGDNAEHKVQYDSSRRVTQNTVASNGFQYNYAYSDSSFGNVPNNWKQRTTRSAPDGTYVRVYANHVAQVMLHQFSTDNPDTSPGSRWIEHQTFDAGYRLDLRVMPSGIDMGATTIFDPTAASLSVQMRPSLGLFHIWEYGTGSPQPAGYLTAFKVRKGTGGSPQTIRTYTYTSRGFGSHTVYPVATETIYRNTDATGNIQTNFYYDEWQGSGNAGVKQRRLILPNVPTSQNGTGVTVGRRELYDEFGNLTAAQNERLYVDTYAYDLPTGGMTQMVQDTNKPSGLSPAWPDPPSGTRLNLTTDFQIDEEGRQTRSLGPQHSVDLGGTATLIRTATWTIYDDCGATYDEVRTGQGYQNGSTGVFWLVNPVSISRTRRDGLGSDQIVATRGSTVESQNPLTASDSFPSSSWVRRAEEVANAKGQVTESRLYHNLSTNSYNPTTFRYDPNTGRQVGVMTPGGTITRGVFDARGRATQTWVGLNDNGSTAPFFTTGTNDLVKINASQYDGGADGANGNLTLFTEFPVPTSSATDRLTILSYDFRDRQTDVIRDDGTFTTTTITTYDNLDQATIVERKDGSNNLIGKSKIEFDNMGRIYRRWRHSVTAGTAGDALVDDIYHDDAGNVIKEVSAASEAFTKATYDGAGRVTKQTVGYETGGADKVFHQVTSTYDPASNLIQTEVLARFHNATGTGDLVANTSARPSYTAYYTDGVGRQKAVARYGTNGGTTFSRSDTIPARSDTCLVDSTTYSIRGEAETQTDPRGIVTYEAFDNAGRRTIRIENYVSASSSSSSTSPCFTEDQNVTTRWTYNADSRVATSTVENPHTGNQTTTYDYQTRKPASGLNTNDLLHRITFADSSTMTIEYNQLDERIRFIDQNGTVHDYAFDKAGRMTDDRISNFPAGVENTIDRIGTTFDVRGRVDAVTAYNRVGGTVNNQVTHEYNGLDMLTKQYQEHLGAKGTNTLYVGYNYDTSATGGRFTKGMRLTSLRYPSGRLVNHDYGSSGGDGDKLGRVEAIKDNDGTTVLAAYTYLGLDRVVTEDYQEPDVRLDYTATGTGVYPGLDRFDRVVDQRWIAYGTNPGDRDRFEHGYDRNGNQLFSKNYACAQKDELRSYDALSRLKTYRRGTLSNNNTQITTPVRQEDFSRDPSANWKCYDVSGTGATALNQRRTHSLLNKITSITESPGQPQWADPAYDTAGDMLRVPQPKDLTSGFDLKYDGWGRLVDVTPSPSDPSSSSSSPPSSVGQYRYGSFDSPTVKYTPSSGKYRHFYTLPDGRVVETRETTSPTTIPTDYHYQWLWSVRGDNVLILRDQFSGSPGRLYCLSDARFSITSLTTAAGSILERYVYSADGTILFLDGACHPIAGNVSQYDNGYTYRAASWDAATYLLLDRLVFYHADLGRYLAYPTTYLPSVDILLALMPLTVLAAETDDEETKKLKESIANTLEDLEKGRKLAGKIFDALEKGKETRMVDLLKALAEGKASIPTVLKVIKILRAFDARTACGRWYIRTYRCIAEAGTKCRATCCDDIEGRLGRQTTAGDRCWAYLIEKGAELAVVSAFSKASTALAAKCRELAKNSVCCKDGKRRPDAPASCDEK